MRLAFADPRNMTLSPLNMHHGRPPPDVSDLLASVRARGVLLTLLVLEKTEGGQVVDGCYEIVAGRRRWHAALAVIAEGREIDPLPIGILEPGDDAAALEASLLENLKRLPPDEVTCWETFSRLIRAGRTVEQIAATFGQSEVVVRRTLALGALLPRIRRLYRDEAIDVATVRALTLASKAQQKAWLALHDDPGQRAPAGAQLKAWLFGGSSIPTRHAIFDLSTYPGEIVTDLFGEDSYFADAESFWRLQNEAIAARAEAWRAEGWAGVEVLAAGQPFYSWNHERVGRSDGGKVFVEVSLKGEVTVHEGYLDRKEAQRLRKAAERAARGEDEAPRAAMRPEVTSAQAAYIDLHRHAAVRLALAEHPEVALRLLLAHAIAGAAHWRVAAEGRRAVDGALAESLAGNAAVSAYEAHRATAAARLGLSAEARSLVGSVRIDGGVAGVFARLLALGEAEVLQVAAVVMAESLAAGSCEVEAAGAWLEVDLRRVWRPDQAFFDLIRDREALNAMLREVGGKKVADGNLAEKLKTQKAILKDFVDGTGGRPKAEGWIPRWMAFPPAAYTKRHLPQAARARAVAAQLRKARPAAAIAAE
jgi:ParB family chromosome partitioning protein